MRWSYFHPPFILVDANKRLFRLSRSCLEDCRVVCYEIYSSTYISLRSICGIIVIGKVGGKIWGEREMEASSKLQVLDLPKFIVLVCPVILKNISPNLMHMKCSCSSSNPAQAQNKSISANFRGKPNNTCLAFFIPSSCSEHLKHSFCTTRGELAKK